MNVQYEAEEQRDELVEQVAREIQLLGLTGPAVHFLEASRPYRALGANAMLFFDPVLRGVFGGELASVTEILADDTGIELLIARLEESFDSTPRGNRSPPFALGPNTADLLEEFGFAYDSSLFGHDEPYPTA